MSATIIRICMLLGVLSYSLLQVGCLSTSSSSNLKQTLSHKPIESLTPEVVISEQSKGKSHIGQAKFDSEIKGIYISQASLEDRKYLEYLILKAQQVGINTFVIDLDVLTNQFEKNILLVRNSGITYIARIAMFPKGGFREQVQSRAHWVKKYRLVEAAVRLGAKEVQLDSLYYSPYRRATREDIFDMARVVDWYKNKMKEQSIPLQISILGKTSFGQVSDLGQSIALLARSVDVVSPMLYPSHFKPYHVHASQPYELIYSGIEALKQQFNDDVPFKIYPYIELSNYHFPMSFTQTRNYLTAQIKAVEDAKANGWLAWSPNNKYDSLFDLLEHSS